jgi:hypothetical protein
MEKPSVNKRTFFPHPQIFVYILPIQESLLVPGRRPSTHFPMPEKSFSRTSLFRYGGMKNFSLHAPEDVSSICEGRKRNSNSFVKGMLDFKNYKLLTRPLWRNGRASNW